MPGTIIQYLHYEFLSLFNWWQECDEPRWMANRRRAYGDILYISGRTFRYKIVATDWGQGWEKTKCYQKYRKHILQEKAGLIHK